LVTGHRQNEAGSPELRVFVSGDFPFKRPAPPPQTSASRNEPQLPETAEIFYSLEDEERDASPVAPEALPSFGKF
jgi:hypothetical protein